MTKYKNVHETAVLEGDAAIAAEDKALDFLKMVPNIVALVGTTMKNQTLDAITNLLETGPEEKAITNLVDAINLNSLSIAKTHSLSVMATECLKRHKEYAREVRKHLMNTGKSSITHDENPSMAMRAKQDCMMTCWNALFILDFAGSRLFVDALDEGDLITMSQGLHSVGGLVKVKIANVAVFGD